MEHIFQTGNFMIYFMNYLVFSNNLTTTIELCIWKKKALDNQRWRHTNCDSATWVKSCFNIWYKLVHLSLSLPFHSLVDYVEVPSLVRQWNRLRLFIAKSDSCFFTALTHKKRSRDGNRAPCLRIHLGSLASLLRNIVLRRRVGKTPLKKYTMTHTHTHTRLLVLVWMDFQHEVHHIPHKQTLLRTPQQGSHAIIRVGGEIMSLKWENDKSLMHWEPFRVW